MGERAAYTLARGLEQSPTFRALVDRLERSDIVVYVAIAPQPSKAAPGGIQFLSASTVFRFLRVVLSPELTTSQMVALLGHELQHALEVAETREIRDRASFLQYYGRLGVDGRDHLSLDSQAARDTGERIKLELARTVPPVQRD